MDRPTSEVCRRVQAELGLISKTTLNNRMVDSMYQIHPIVVIQLVVHAKVAAPCDRSLPHPTLLLRAHTGAAADSACQYVVEFVDNNPLHWRTAVTCAAPQPGQDPSPFQDGVFELEVELPRNYPFMVPRVRFVTPMFHPNIDERGGVELDILLDWSPATFVGKVGWRDEPWYDRAWATVTRVL
jgi:hypothetical protein